MKLLRIEAAGRELPGIFDLYYQTATHLKVRRSNARCLPTGSSGECPSDGFRQKNQDAKDFLDSGIK